MVLESRDKSLYIRKEEGKYMRLHLSKHLGGNMSYSPKWCIEEMQLEESELGKRLELYLTDFTVGIQDPDIKGVKPDKFISNLISGRLGEFSKRYIITAHDKGAVIGILIGLPIDDLQFHVYSLHVAPLYRKKGVGSALLVRCVDDMVSKKINQINIDVHINNEPAYKLYRKFGFMEV